MAAPGATIGKTIGGKTIGAPVDGVTTLPTKWRETLMICRKCGKRLQHGFGAQGEDSLRQALRGELRAIGQRGSVGLIETGCFGVCPKDGVTVLRGGAPGQLMVVAGGADLRGLLRQLLPSGEPSA